MERTPTLEPLGLPESDPASLDANAKRTYRAATEEMIVVPQTDAADEHATGFYYVLTANNSEYEVDLGVGRCSCPDMEHRDPDGGCKHLRRVVMEVNLGRLPAPREPLGDDFWRRHEERIGFVHERANELLAKSQHLRQLADAAEEAAELQR